jgi:hypothetical protein
MNANQAVKAANQANAALSPLSKPGNAPPAVNRAANAAIQANQAVIAATNTLRNQQVQAANAAAAAIQAPTPTNTNRAALALNKLREANVALKKAVENAQKGNKNTINAVLAA